MKLQDVSKALWPLWGRQGWLGARGPALCSPVLAASGTASRRIRIDDLVQEDCTLKYL